MDTMQSIVATTGTDELVLGAGKEILGIYIVGPICIVLGAIVVFLDRRITKERDRGDALLERLLLKTAEVAVIGEEARETTKSQVDALRAALDLLKERAR